MDDVNLAPKEGYIMREFSALTETTAPYPHDLEIFEDYLDATGRSDWEWRAHKGGLILDVGDDPETMFLAHLDTVGPKEPTKVERLYDPNSGFMFSDAKTILGADDRAGIVLLLWLIEHEVPGRYVFPVGEEVGMVGSSMMRSDREVYAGIKRAIQFDRRGYGSIITHQMGGRTCSDVFARALAGQLNPHMYQTGKDKYAPDATGSYTDSANFADVIPECTNVSVGYFNEHTHMEEIDLFYLEDLAAALLKVDWDSLPTERGPKEEELYKYTTLSFGEKPQYDPQEEEFYSWLVSQDKKLVADTLDLKDGYVLDFIQWLIDTNRALEDELNYVWFSERTEDGNTKQ